MTQSTPQQTQGTSSPGIQHDSTMQACITACLKCAEVCSSTLKHCLSIGGKHAESDHVKALTACAEICTLSAKWMKDDVKFHTSLCRTCAEVCNACAKSCESVGADEEMQKCIDACRKCADSCTKMAAH